MDLRYEEHIVADAVFYDALIEAPNVRRLDVAVPDGWHVAELGDWRHYLPEGVSLPAQGWKVHVSSCVPNAPEVLAAVGEYCVAQRLAFKHLPTVELVFLRNSKSADRSASGKFVTIYPVDEVELTRTLEELGACLAGQPGPYILSDLRWGDGPLYVRYGGFLPRTCTSETGALVPAIEDPAGTLVPDERGPVFRPPAWVELPEILAPHLEARDALTVDELPYRIESALHFSNGGGVYRGVELESGTPVVLKEARPHAGLSGEDRDAIVGLESEHAVLRRLEGLAEVPTVFGLHTVGAHRFLALEDVDGDDLNQLVVRRHPLLGPEPPQEDVAEYTEWAVTMCERVEAAVRSVHERGVVIGDFHPRNVLVRPDGRIVLIDWETATGPDDDRIGIGAPGFAPPRRVSGTDVDDFALACLRLYVFLPLTRLYLLAPGKAAEHALAATELFPVPPGFLDTAVQTIERVLDEPARPTGVWGHALTADVAGLATARTSLARAIAATATPERADRLFPGDVQQFAVPGGGLGLAFGAAGVLYALHAAGEAVDPTHVDWLAARATDPPRGTPSGLYDGLHGIAFAFDSLGHDDAAAKVLERALTVDGAAADARPLGLFGGLAGIGLNLAHFAATTGDPALRDASARTIAAVADRLGGEDSVGAVSGGAHPYAGLLRGSSGPALLFLDAYERSGDAAMLDLAARALRQDLRRCLTDRRGGLQVNEGWRSLPYLGDGSAGIGMVLARYLAHRDDEHFREAAAAARGTSAGIYFAQSGLFNGRAGFVLARGATADEDPAIADHVRRLRWHALAHEGELVFPGDQLLRLSLDLGTGSAGVLLALAAAAGEPAAHLPFLPPPRLLAARPGAV